MISICRDSMESRVLAWMRFPLAALVVLIHTSYPDDSSTATFYLGRLLSSGIAQIAVPTFFFMSGYLFFARYKKFGWKEYSSAMKRKFVSLAVPYFLWISVIYYPYNIYLGNDVLGCGHWLYHLYKVFWCGGEGYVSTSLLGYKFSILSTPMGSSVLWFVRDLMVAMALTPIFWWIIRQLKIWAVAFFLLPYLLHIGAPLPLQGFGYVALCFFPLGATFSICGCSVIDIVRRYGKIILSIYLLLFAVYYVVGLFQFSVTRLLIKFVIIVGVGAAFCVGYLAVMYTRYASRICMLGEASFFLYIGHTTPFFNFLGHIDDSFYNGTWWGPLFAYIFTWGFRVVVVTTLYFAMKRVCPRLLSLLVGGRISVSRHSETIKG